MRKVRSIAKAHADAEPYVRGAMVCKTMSPYAQGVMVLRIRAL